MKTSLFLVVVLLVVILATLFLMGAGNERNTGRYQLIVVHQESLNGRMEPYFYIMDTQIGVAIRFWDKSNNHIISFKKELEEWETE